MIAKFGKRATPASPHSSAITEANALERTMAFKGGGIHGSADLEELEP